MRAPRPGKSVASVRTVWIVVILAIAFEVALVLVFGITQHFGMEDRADEALDCLLRGVVGICHDHHRPHISHIRADGEAEEQHQYQRHAEEYQHRPLVAHDVLCFLDDKTIKLLHNVQL